MNKLRLTLVGMSCVGACIGSVTGGYYGYNSTKNQDITTNHLGTLAGFIVGTCQGAFMGGTFPISIFVLIGRRMENIPLFESHCKDKK